MNQTPKGEARTDLRALLERCLPIIQADAQMMADITRHSPLDAESQAAHDSTEYESEKLAREIPAALALTWHADLVEMIVQHFEDGMDTMIYRSEVAAAIRRLAQSRTPEPAPESDKEFIRRMNQKLADKGCGGVDSAGAVAEAAQPEPARGFRCPKCGSERWGTSNCTDPHDKWIGHCHGEGCLFTWHRQSQDAEVGLGVESCTK